MSVLVRAIAYAALFIGFVLVFVPARLVSWSGINPPATMGLVQIIAMLLGAAGASLALWCVATFAFAGKGTPAPFDPPRQLVVRGPYGVVRNPMYLGAGLALAGAALFISQVRSPYTRCSSCSACICSSSCTRSPLCEGRSVTRTWRTAAGSPAGGRRSESRRPSRSASIDSITGPAMRGPAMAARRTRLPVGTDRAAGQLLLVQQRHQEEQLSKDRGWVELLPTGTPGKDPGRVRERHGEREPRHHAGVTPGGRAKPSSPSRPCKPYRTATAQTIDRTKVIPVQTSPPTARQFLSGDKSARTALIAGYLRIPKPGSETRSWSLSVEEQLYLLWPFALAAFGFARGRRLAMALLLLAPALRILIYLLSPDARVGS